MGTSPVPTRTPPPATPTQTPVSRAGTRPPRRGRPGRARWPLSRSPLVNALAAGAAYFVATRASAAFVVATGGLAIFWPPTGLIVGMLLLTRQSQWPALAASSILAGMFANIGAGVPMPLAFGYPALDVATGVVAVWLLKRFSKAPHRVDAIRDVIALAAAAVVSEMMGGATAAWITARQNGLVFWDVWRVWWLADAVGIIVITPLILCARQFRRRLCDSPARLVEGIAVLAGCATVGWLLFAVLNADEGSHISHLYLTFPFLMWAAVRFEVLGSSMAMAVMTIGAASVLGDSHVSVSAYRIVDLRAFVGITAVSTLLLATVIRQRRIAEQGLARARQQVIDVHLATIEALALAIDAKDATARTHVRHVQTYAMKLATSAGLTPEAVEAIGISALLHDIGKLAIPDQILSKPGPLTAREFERIRIHPDVGADLLETVPFPYPIAPSVRAHHERWDGSGYPAGLKGEEIPIGARIIAVADRFDAVRTERPYRAAFSRDDAIAYVHREAGTGLDPSLVDLFVRLLPQMELTAGTDERRPSVAPAVSGVLDQRPANPPARNVFADIAVAQRELYALYEIAESMGTGLGMHDTMTLIADKLGRVVRFSTCALFIKDAEQQISCAFATGEGAEELLATSAVQDAGVVGWVMANRRVVINSTADLSDMSKVSRQALGTGLICPLTRQEMSAALAVFREIAAPFDDNDARLFERVAKQAEAVLFNARAFDQAQAESLTDPLTGLPNRRCLDRQVVRILSRAERSHGRISVLLVDMDHFKRLNDLFGHATGDAALRGVARVLESNMRAYDVCSRYAGDEFVIVMDDCPPEVAARKAAAFEQMVADLSVKVAGHGHVNLSCTVGTATYPEDGATFDALLAVADSRMFSAKSLAADTDALA